MNNHFNSNYILEKIKTIVIYWLFPLVLIIFIRLIMDQSHWLKMANVSYKAGSYIEAIAYNDRVLQAYIPFSPYATKARENLLQISKWGKENNEYKLSLIAIETLKSTSLYTRHIWPSDQKSNPSPSPFSFILMFVFFIFYFYNSYLFIKNHSLLVFVYAAGSFVIWYTLLKII